MLHEFGHWLMAKLCGYQPVAFSVGEGKLWWRRETVSSLWEFHLWPVSGYIVALKLSGTESKLERFLLSFGGPLFSALCGVAAFFGYRWFDAQGMDGAALHQVLAQVMAITCVLSALSVIYNVWPVQGTGGNPNNDGLQMLLTLRSKSFPKCSTYEELLRQNPTDPTGTKDGTPQEFTPEAEALYVGYFRATLAKRTADVLHIIQQALALPALTTRERTVWRVQLLTAALEHPKEPSLSEAALASTTDELEQAQPSSMLCAMVGAIHIELGHHMEGRTLLYPLERHADADEWKAFAIAYLAISDFRQGWKLEAAERLRTARQLCPVSPAVVRADAEIHGGFYGRL